MLSFQHLDIQLIFRTRSPMALPPTIVLPGNIKSPWTQHMAVIIMTAQMIEMTCL